MIDLKPREPRRATRIAARLRSDGEWVDVVIGNVSRRGVMIMCPGAPARGKIVEVRCRGTVIVARVVWSTSDRCGLYSQDEVEWRALCGGKIHGSPIEPDHVRACNRGRRGTSPEAIYAASGRWARLTEWLAVAIFGAWLAASVADLVFNSMDMAFDRITATLPTSAR